MTSAIRVPPNTMLADLDEALRALVERELGRQGFDGACVSFEAPTGRWAGEISAPTVNLFLYDLREKADQAGDGWREHRANGQATLRKPPLMLDCTYAVTAWARAVEDEHRLLSQVMAILLAHEQLPADVLGDRLAPPGAERPVLGHVGRPKADGKAEFWNAIGGGYKVSLDYVVTLPVERGVTFARGPEVTRRQLVAKERGARSGAVHEQLAKSDPGNRTA